MLNLILFASHLLLIYGLNCNTSSNSCSENPQCINYQFDIMTMNCIDCSSLASSDCVYINQNICTTYILYNGSCIDCSTVENNTCKYSNVLACSQYGYDGSSKCYNCSQAQQSQCIYQRVTGCSRYAYNSKNSKCFNCNGNGIIWSDSMCEACFESQDLTAASDDLSKCVDPSISSATSSQLLKFLFTFYLLKVIIIL